MQTVLPLTEVYSPGVHSLHELLLIDAEYEPLAHGVHADMELIPGMLLNVPTAQPSQTLAPDILEKVPSGQGIDAPVFE